MKVTRAYHHPSIQHRSAPRNLSNNGPAPAGDGFAIDVAGGAAAAFLAGIAAAGTAVLKQSPNLGFLGGAVIGARGGMVIADTAGTNMAASIAVGTAVGLGCSAAGYYGGLPAALGVAAAAFAIRGVAVPMMLQ